ncbi:PepSY domain-containing protein [Radiobacillus kanasensis]|uniref:PepSY domain-containing protein n=1 Tax=Radiobacillus kanasensis TaxID=2844358 RepID=UPI001E475A7A|nr:PepSY domain-containing protein [Radiobacillus kanasensis]UFT98144.1 PepSY domain-containing protein [Radiobacillus kanasensis]
MKWSRLLVAAGIGALVGYVVKEQVNTTTSYSPEKALNSAKEAFRKEGPISGSWIYMKTKELVKNGLTYTVYHGGITRTVEGEDTPFEFYVDAHTGTIVEVAESA